MFDAIQAWDFGAIEWIYGIRTEPLAGFFSIITHLADKGLFWILLALILLIPKKTRKAGLTMGIAMAIGIVIGNGILKNAVARMRPYDYYDLIYGTKNYIDTIVAKPDDFSFPSGHSQASFAAALALFFNHKKAGIAAIVLAILIALSRFYLCIHFPTDIICGSIMGILWAIIANKLVTMYYDRRDANSGKIRF